jgi:hypothetical protein
MFGNRLSIFFCLFLNIVFCLGSQAAFAQTMQPTVYELDAVDSIHTRTDLSQYTALHAAAYYCTTQPCIADGGEGLFVKYGIPGASCPADGGSVIQDNTPHSKQNCWYRQNVKGDFRQWGLTANSLYDANYASSVHGTQQNSTHVLNWLRLRARRSHRLRGA